MNFDYRNPALILLTVVLVGASMLTASAQTPRAEAVPATRSAAITPPQEPVSPSPAAIEVAPAADDDVEIEPSPSPTAIVPGTPGTPPASQATETPPPIAPNPVIAAVRTKLTDTTELRRTIDNDDLSAIETFYTGDLEKPVWTSQNGLSQLGKDAIEEIAKAGDWGLRASDFDLPALTGLSFTAEQLAEAELKTAIAVLKYARFARGGRFDPSSVSRLFDQSPETAEPFPVLLFLARSTDIARDLRAHHPKHPQFERLRQALLELRRKEKEAAASSADADDAAQRPAVEADKPDKTQKASAKTKQKHANSKSPVSELKLIVNMERWRWLPRELGDFYVWDAVPAQYTSIIDNGKVVLKEKMVVGKPNTPTPMFSSPMRHVIFHPSWGVPPGMKKNELLPQLRNTGGGWFSSKPLASAVLQSHGLQVTRNGQRINPDSIDWSSANISEYHFTQPPGRTNVLGIVKFLFPNRHNVYMHDTPERHLFNSNKDRTYSHGCMRVQNPVKFAEVLLKQDKGWDTERVQQAKSRGENIDLEKPIPVHVTYFTIEVDDDGKIDVHRDIYGLDNRLASKLEGKSVRLGGPAIAKTKRKKSSRRTYARKKKSKPTKKPFNPFASIID
ncbi:MAG: L,D-transpeptidase family protein [Alphaproteobacteria bacterium]|nr:L,D-transpeptidase family protein [Alphaproteobacteria bacterium]